MKSKKNKVGLLFIDVDDFKKINDTFGHVAGDRILKQVASGFNETKSKDIFFSRLGGDEFAVVIDDIENKDDFYQTAEKILAGVYKTVRSGRFDMRFSVSVGGALYPDRADSLSYLMKSADTATYHQKERGKDGIYIRQE